MDTNEWDKHVAISELLDIDLKCPHCEEKLRKADERKKEREEQDASAHGPAPPAPDAPSTGTHVHFPIPYPMPVARQ